MKKILIIAVISVIAVGVMATQPVRVALVDFENQAGKQSSDELSGGITSESLANKGVYTLSRELLDSDEFVLIDRRDFMDQMEKMKPMDMGKKTPVKPSFIQAAQALNADVVLRGVLLSFSPGKSVVNQGGFKTEFVTLTVQVGLQALDSTDGAVIAMADGEATGKYRQTAATYTELSESDAMKLMDEAINNAIPQLEKSLNKRMAKLEARPKIKLNVKTDADPAMVEIDGVLVGTTPVEGLEVYVGDHVLTVGKPGYQDITKRIMFEKDSSVEVPMLRTELSADEWKEILEKARLNVFQGIDPGIIIHTVE